MTEEILDAKLSELGERLTRLNSRIRQLQMDPPQNLEEQIASLNQSCIENQLALERKLSLSKAEKVRILDQMYQAIQKIIQEGTVKLQCAEPGAKEGEAAEGKILLAEYALDFAFQVSDCALLYSLEALDARLKEEARKE